jgi:hypothetical protein
LWQETKNTRAVKRMASVLWIAAGIYLLRARPEPIRICAGVDQPEGMRRPAVMAGPASSPMERSALPLVRRLRPCEGCPGPRATADPQTIFEGKIAASTDAREPEWPRSPEALTAAAAWCRPRLSLSQTSTSSEQAISSFLWRSDAIASRDLVDGNLLKHDVLSVRCPVVPFG